MKNLTIKSLFLGLLVAAAMALTACGGGSSDSGSDVNPGDGVVTQTEASSIRAGMSKEQIIAILGTPTLDTGTALQWNGPLNNGKTTGYQVGYLDGVPAWLVWWERVSGINLSITKIPA